MPAMSTSMSTTTNATTGPVERLRLRVGDGIVSAAESRRRALAHDASHYLLHPAAVATPRSVDDVARLFAACRDLGLPLTFRSGGSSLSGQASTEHLLVDTRRAFKGMAVLDGGAAVRVEPGVTIGQVNARLARYGRRLGPDPASEVACTIGGLVANNSSGMTCGTTTNTYRTLRSAVLVLPSGTVLDTGAGDADAVLRAAEPALYRELGELRDRVRANPDSLARIEALYGIKNTMGYGVNSFVDFDTPVDLLLHLVIGSEGTLAFVASAEFDTVPVRGSVATGLLVFDTLAGATAVLDELAATGPAVIELLDRTSLAVSQRDPRGGARLAGLAVDQHAALLVEYQEDDADALGERLAAAEALTGGLALARPATFSADAGVRADLWYLRKGLYAAVAGNRPQGTSALLEDVAVPRAALLALCEDLLRMFEAHDYVDPVIFGHAKDGNIHFLLGERFDDPAAMARYDAFTEEMVDLVLGLGGTLKAEHGTGRTMAPFVERQVGPELYDVMRTLKRACDPAGILNPGVLLSDDPRIHVAHLKTTVPVEDEVTDCVECGYCEPVCPSRDLTTTPRQRIALRREIAAARLRGDDALAERLEEESWYAAVDTCAVDGMCSTACPLGIDTGALVKRQRAGDAGAAERAAWDLAARQWRSVSRLAGAVLTGVAAVPGAAVAARGAADLGRLVLGEDTVPAYVPGLPGGGARRPRHDDAAAEAVVFASCTSAMFGPEASGGGAGVPVDGAAGRDGSAGRDGAGVADPVGASEALRRLLQRAGVRWRTPADPGALCCTMPWTSKGMTGGAAAMARRVADDLWAATDAGRLPVVCDAASCTEGLSTVVAAAREEGRELRVVDALAYVAGTVLPRLRERGLLGEPAWGTAVLHPTCATRKAGLDPALTALASAVARDVRVPAAWGCCGFAGDRGLLHPELTASATAGEAAEVRGIAGDVYLSANRTCELGMTRATGRRYVHALEALEAATRR